MATVDRVLGWLEKIVAVFPASRGTVAAIEIREGTPGHPVTVASLPYDVGDLQSVAVQVSDAIEILAGDRTETRRGVSFSLVAVDDQARALVGPYRIHLAAPSSATSATLAPSSATLAPSSAATPPSSAAHVGYVQTAERALIELLFNRLTDSTESAIALQKSASEMVTRTTQGIEGVMGHVTRSHDAMRDQLSSEKAARVAAEEKVAALEAIVKDALATAKDSADTAEKLREKLGSPVERAKEAFLTDVFKRAAAKVGIPIDDDDDAGDGTVN